MFTRSDLAIAAVSAVVLFGGMCDVQPPALAPERRSMIPTVECYGDARDGAQLARITYPEGRGYVTDGYSWAPSPDAAAWLGVRVLAPLPQSDMRRAVRECGEAAQLAAGRVRP